jgi:hypothetical protein
MGQLRHGFDEVLAVVQDKEQLLRADGINQRLRKRPAGQFSDTEHGGDSLWNQEGFSKRGQLDQPNAVSILFEERSGHVL